LPIIRESGAPCQRPAQTAGDRGAGHRARSPTPGAITPEAPPQSKHLRITTAERPAHAQPHTHTTTTPHTLGVSRQEWGGPPASTPTAGKNSCSDGEGEAEARGQKTRKARPRVGARWDRGHPGGDEEGPGPGAARTNVKRDPLCRRCCVCGRVLGAPRGTDDVRSGLHRKRTCWGAAMGTLADKPNNKKKVLHPSIRISMATTAPSQPARRVVGIIR